MVSFKKPSQDEARIQVVEILLPRKLWNWGTWNRFEKGTLPEPNSSHLKMDGWNMIVSFWGQRAYFSGIFAVTFREGNHLKTKPVLGCGCKYVFLFTPIYLGEEDSRFDWLIFFRRGLVQPPTSVCWGFPFGVFQWFFVPLRKWNLATGSFVECGSTRTGKNDESSMAVMY